MRWRTIRMAGWLGLLLVWASAAAGFGQSAEEILRRSSLFGSAAGARMRIGMEIVKGQGVKSREMEAFIRRDGRASRLLLHVVSPAFLNQMKFLFHREGDGRESQWMKTSQGVRRLAGSNRSEAIFDSDFTAEDLSDLRVEDFSLALLGEEPVGGRPCHRIEMAPRFSGSSYHKKQVLVEKGSGLLFGADFFDAAGALVRRYRLLDTQRVQGSTFPLACRMENLAAGTHTLLRFQRIEPADSLPDKLFNRAAL